MTHGEYDDTIVSDGEKDAELAVTFAKKQLANFDWKPAALGSKAMP